MALGVSAALHVVLLFGFERIQPASPTQAPGLLQVLVGFRPEVSPRVTSAPAPPAKRESGPSPRLAVPQPSPAPAVPVAESLSVPVAPPLPAAIPASPAPSANSAGGEGRPEGVDADGLRQYRIDLATAARRFRVYPAVARARGWEGTVELAISFGPLLPAPLVRVTRSSGHSVLDEQALSMLTQAVRVAPVPESLRGRELNISLPIRFSLDD